MSEDWKQAWQPVIAAIGQEMWEETSQGVDVVEPGTIRRYLEPLELGCALHYDAAVAREHGYADIIAPYTSVIAFSQPAMWKPGEPPLYVDDDKDAQPARTNLKSNFPDFFPPYSAFFVTDFEVEYIRPAILGERLQRRGAKLVGCEPKETRVGRGAFISMEWRTETTAGEIVALTRSRSFIYNPHPES